MAEPLQSTLSGVARVLVHAGKLQPKAAEELARSAKEKKTSFVAAVMAASAVSPTELAHTLAHALALPLLDLNALDLQKLPRNIIDAKLAAQYQVLVLADAAADCSSPAPTRPTRRQWSASSSPPSCRRNG